jgi:hypothetical protein
MKISLRTFEGTIKGESVFLYSAELVRCKFRDLFWPLLSPYGQNCLQLTQNKSDAENRAERPRDSILLLLDPGVAEGSHTLDFLVK